MGLYRDLGIRDDMQDAELATWLSQQRSVWNSRRSSADIRERMDAEQKVRQIDVLSGAEARIGDFPAPALVIRTLCVAIDNRYADYRGLESTVLRSVSNGVYRGEFRTVLGYLNSVGAQDVSGEWRSVLREMGIELPPARSMSRGSTERSEQREYLERHDRDRMQRTPAGRYASGPQDTYSQDGDQTVPEDTGRQYDSRHYGDSREGGDYRQNGREQERGERRQTPRSQAGRTRSGSRHKRKVPWQRKVKRFFRRIGRFFRNIDWEAVPKQLIATIAGVIAAIIIVAIVMTHISRSNSSRTASTTEASTAAATMSAEQQAQLQQDALIARLRGMESFSQTSDTSELSSYGTVRPANCEASSVLSSSSGKTYGTDYLFDNDLTTSWQEGEADEGIGVTITSTFSSETDIKGIAFWIGNESSPESYMANNRPEQITVSVSCEGQSYSKGYTLQDVNGEQAILFESPVPMESVVIRIDTVYKGTVYNDTVISEMAFLTEGSSTGTASGSTDGAAAGAADGTQTDSSDSTGAQDNSSDGTADASGDAAAASAAQ